MDVTFIKLYVFNNDFLFLNYLYKQYPGDHSIGAVARSLCKRKTGIGSNGIICLLPGEEEKCRVKVFTPYGQSTSICNDALLCLSRYAFDSGLFVHSSLRVETEQGLRLIQAIDSRNFRLSIGTPYYVGEEENTPLREFPNREYTDTVHIHSRKYVITPVRIQQNGAVLFSENNTKRELKDLSLHIYKNYTSAQPVLPVFVRIVSREDIWIDTWFKFPPVEYSSAASIGGVAAVLNGFCDRELVLHKGAEECYFQWHHSNNEVFITASPQYVFSGSYYFEEHEEMF
jgi:diaminopimelate epimerase